MKIESELNRAIFEDACKIRGMNASNRIKIRMLSELFSAYENIWEVVGVSKDALEVFQKHDFKKVSKMGINRAHEFDRHETYDYLLNNKFQSEGEWWKYFKDRNHTVLRTSNENMNGGNSEIFQIPRGIGLFKSRGFAWKHNKEEIECLRSLYRRYIMP